jgi:hypothetical protein
MQPKDSFPKADLTPKIVYSKSFEMNQRQILGVKIYVGVKKMIC